MKGDAFFFFVTQHLYPRWLAMKAEFPIVLVVDGYSSHKNTQLFVWCKEHEIILLLLYPNSTHILQVLDIGIFGPLKMKYFDLYQEWSELHPTESFTELEFIKVLKATNDVVLKPETIINSWRATGLQPFEFANVNLNILVTHSPSQEMQNVSQPNILTDRPQSNEIHIDQSLNYEVIMTLPIDDSDFAMYDTVRQDAENQLICELEDQGCDLELCPGNLQQMK